MLTLNGYVAFNLPRAVTAAGSLLLAGLVAVHVYLLVTTPTPPGYFVAYCVALIAGCVAAMAAMAFARNPAVPQRGWQLGSLVSVVFLGLYLASRAVGLPGLVGLTGRWDLAPGSLSAACAMGFIGLHMSVLLGINVAYPQRRHWHD